MLNYLQIIVYILGKKKCLCNLKYLKIITCSISETTFVSVASRRPCNLLNNVGIAFNKLAFLFTFGYVKHFS